MFFIKKDNQEDKIFSPKIINENLKQKLQLIEIFEKNIIKEYEYKRILILKPKNYFNNIIKILIILFIESDKWCII